MLCLKCGEEVPDGNFCILCGWDQRKKPPRRRAMKRPNGTGSVFKLQGRRSRPWAAYHTLGFDSNGRQIRVILGYYQTRTEAFEELARHPKPKIGPRYAATLGDVFESWKAVHYRQIGKKGEEGYNSAWKRLSVHKDVPMREIRAPHFQQVIDAAAREGLSYSSCDKIRQLASQLCQNAMQDDILNKNYAEFIVMPRQEKKKKDIFTQEEIDLLFAHDDDPSVRIILCLIYTGFRLSEFFGITRDGVHLNELVEPDGTRRAVSGYLVGGLKTEAGRNRVVPINRRILDYIVGFYAQGGKYLVQTAAGTPKNKDNFRDREFYPTLDRLGIMPAPKKGEKPRLTPHCTRHTFISMAIASQVPPEVLKLLVGHAQYSTTVDFYDHEDFGRLMEAIAAM